MSVPCVDLDIWIERFRDGDLAGRARQDAEAHLEACETCRERLAEIEHVGSLVASAFAKVELPIAAEELSRRIAARLDELPALSMPAAHRRSVAAWRYALAAAITGFVVVSGALWLDRAKLGGQLTARMQTWIGQGDVELADDAAEEPVRVELARQAPEAPPVRLVSSTDPQWQVVWIGNEGPQP